MDNMHDGQYGDQSKQVKDNTAYTYVEHQLKLSILEFRPVAEHYGDVAIYNLVSHAALHTQTWNNAPLTEE